MTGRLLKTDEVACRLNVTARWVCEHAAELGGIRIGHPRYGELRFPAAAVDDYLERRRLRQPDRTHQACAARRKRSDVPLLPLPKGAM